MFHEKFEIEAVVS